MTQSWIYFKNRPEINLRQFHYYGFGRNECKDSRQLIRYAIDLKMFQEALQTSDIIIINMGVHYRTCTETEYRISLNKVSHLLRNEIDRNSWKVVIF